MNPIACLPADSLPEPRSESPAPGATGDVDPAEFGLALALAAAAQSQAAVVIPAAPVVPPAPAPAGDAWDSAAGDATHTLAENVTGALVAVPRPAFPASAPAPVSVAGTTRLPATPLPARSAATGLEGSPLPAAPVGPEAKAPSPPLPARPVVEELEGTSPRFLPARPEPARPEPVRPQAAPAVASGNLDVPANPVAAETATVARDASPRMSDLPLSVRVLELVRGMTEQAARVALDTALSAGSTQDVSLEAAPPSGRGWNAPPQPMEAPPAGGEAARHALAVTVLEALPGPGGPDRNRPATRAPLRPASETVTPGEAATSDGGWMARGAVAPRAAATADPLMPVPRSDVRLASEVPTPAGPAPASAAAEPDRSRSGEGRRDGDGPTRAAGAMLADATAAARAPLADDSVLVSAGPGPSASPGVRPSAGSADPAAGAARTAPAPPEARTSARPGDQITLHFSGEDGLEGKLRVAVRGQNVRATILADDPVAAERFARGLGGLQRTLLDRGFSEAHLNVQQIARSEGPASGNVQRDGNQGDSQPRGESRDRYLPRQERESAFTEDRPDRRPSRQRTER